MFESGAGTADTLAGKNIANPIGRILTGALTLDHLKIASAGGDVRRAVDLVLRDGFRTADIAAPEDRQKGMVLGTQEMGTKIIEYLVGTA